MVAGGERGGGGQSVVVVVEGQTPLKNKHPPVSLHTPVVPTKFTEKKVPYIAWVHTISAIHNSLFLHLVMMVAIW